MSHFHLKLKDLSEERPLWQKHLWQHMTQSPHDLMAHNTPAPMPSQIMFDPQCERVVSSGFVWSELKSFFKEAFPDCVTLDPLYFLSQHPVCSVALFTTISSFSYFCVLFNCFLHENKDHACHNHCGIFKKNMCWMKECINEQNAFTSLV